MPNQFRSTSTHRINALMFFTPHEHPLRTPPSHFVTALLSHDEPLCQHSLPPLFSALEALERCPALCTALNTFPPDIKYTVKASLLIPDQYQKQRLNTLENLFRETDDLYTVIEAAQRVPLPFLLQHRCVYALIEGMVRDQKKYRRELAFLFSQLPVSRLPQHLQKTAISSERSPLSVLAAYSGWYLCSMAENRLSLSMHHQAVLLVNGTILLKFKGKLSGLALQTTLLADGTQLLEGCWYAPIDHRDDIRAAFDQGESRLSTEGEWTFIRAMKEDENETLLQGAQACAAALPERLPQQIAGMTRKEYRYCQDEEF